MDVEDRSVFELPYEKPDETFTFGKSEDQVIDFYLPPDQKKPLIVLIHGGYWRSEYDRKHLAPLARTLANIISFHMYYTLLLHFLFSSNSCVKFLL